MVFLAISLFRKIAAKNLKNDLGEYLSFIPSYEAKKFLAPLPIEFLPIVSEITRRQRSGRWDVLDDLNLMFVEDLQALSSKHLEVAFGKLGRLLYGFAHGVDSRPVTPLEKKSLFFDIDFPKKQITIV